MNILLDTHIAIWAISDHPKLSKKARDLICDPDNTIYFSSVSTWEVMLKNDSKKNNLRLLPKDFVEYCETAGYYQLDMTSKQVIAAMELESSPDAAEHKDPFDRLLLAQAKSENFRFMTADAKFSLYDEKCIIMV